MKHTKLEALACQIAIEAPLRFANDWQKTQISRRTVNEIRAELDRLGVDWRGAKAKAGRAARAVCKNCGHVPCARQLEDAS